jgi:hypothetical protein
MVSNGSSGISDTGLTIRAFLPIDDQGNRSTVHVYNGPAVVVDSRVVCTRPNVTNLQVYLAPFKQNKNYPTPMLHGTISIPLDLTQRASASRLSPDSESTTEFNCSISYGITPDAEGGKYHPSDWNLSICQFDQSANYLRNAWMTLDEPLETTSWPRVPGPVYLLVNFSSQVKFEFTAQFPEVNYSMIQDIFDDSTPGLVRQNRGDWLDMYRTNNKFKAADATLSLSLCYPANTARYLNVSTYSTVPLIQPRYSYDSVSGRIRFDDVRKQMLSSPHTTMEQRGILSLQSQILEQKHQGETPSDTPLPPYLDPYDTEDAFTASAYNDSQSEGASTMNLLQYYQPAAGRADISIGGLLLEILREGGTSAEAVQSMMTTLLASRYQNYVFINGGNITYPTRSDFVTVQIPGGQGRPAFLAAGPTRSYVLVMAAVAVHILVIILVSVWFSKGTCFWP